MSLIKCPECGKEVSSSAVNCPHCGYPLSQSDKAPVKKKEEAKPAEKEVPANVNNEELIKQYEKEVAILSRRRSVMLTWGIIASVISLVAIIVFSCLFSYEVVKQAYAEPIDPAKLTGLSLLYFCLIFLFAFIFEGGLVLILVGTIPNSIKITKRENKIRELRK